MSNSATILVTGAAGFIASHIVRALVDRGATVRALDNLSGGIGWSRLDGVDGVERIEGDIRDSALLCTAVAGVDVVYHLAALVSVPESVDRPTDYNDVCVGGTLNVLEAARRAGTERVVYASSSACYGENPVQPKRESMLPEPVSPYAVAKYAGELYVSAYARLHGMKNVSLRYFNVFGPGQNPRSQYGAAVPGIVARMIAGQQPTVYGDGEQTRDFCHIDNVVRANLLAAEAPTGGLVVNIGTGRRVSVKDIVRQTNAILGTEIEPDYQPPRPGDVRDSLADIQAARTQLGYEPAVHFEQGLAQSIEWYLRTLQ